MKKLYDIMFCVRLITMVKLVLILYIFYLTFVQVNSEFLIDGKQKFSDVLKLFFIINFKNLNEENSI